MPQPPLGSRTGADLRTLAHDLVAQGAASSRAELAQHLGVSASTASTLVNGLVATGMILEVGAGESTGGRRPTLLRAVVPAGFIAVAEFGSSHVRFGLSDLAGSILALEEARIDIARGPEALLNELCENWRELAGSTDGTQVLAGAIALPGPVSALTGEVVGPSRMPGWQGARPAEMLAELIGAPTLAENDARAAALGEHHARQHQPADLIYVKAGSGIGAGLVIGGRPHQGADGVAGDIAHVRVAAEPAPNCSCGRQGCLEAVASGAAIRASLRRDGVPTAGMPELIGLASVPSPEVNAAMRLAGDRLGRALAPLVNFLNPRLVVIGGAMSAIDSFLAATRSALYDYCLPMCTQDLVIDVAAGRDAALRGLAQLGRSLALPGPTS